MSRPEKDNELSQTNPFINTNSHITWAMPRLLGILDSHDSIKADSVKDAAATCAGMLYEPRKLGRSVGRREDRMRHTIGTGITEGFISYSPSKGLQLTDKGLQALNEWRAMHDGRRHTKKPNGRAHGRRGTVSVN